MDSYQYRAMVLNCNYRRVTFTAIVKCGEHKDSKILTCGFFASPSTEEDSVTEVQPTKRLTGLQLADHFVHSMQQDGQSRSLQPLLLIETQSLFEGEKLYFTLTETTSEVYLALIKMQEHVETKSHPHLERPDRLRAIAASLATAVNACSSLIQVRPPGHHAGLRDAMAVAALAALAAGARKVLILDWDVHHGNGTQEIFDQNKSVLYISLHRHDGGKFYPGTGAVDKVLLGENPGYELEYSSPSKSGLQTILEVLKIQKNFWDPSLLSLWKMYCLDKKRKHIKRGRVVAPFWCKCGRKSLLYYYLNGLLRARSK
ncbi:unnamed protein product [Lupinus luteus]|uniref:Histone deacetylase domain-containing protein n=1 Tax=Lupinus luteus TaxID=3873 RepID=A0AAV1XVT8_LUPLU